MKYFYYGIGYLILMAILALIGYGLFLIWGTSNALPLTLVVIYAIYFVSFTTLFLQRRHSSAKISWFLIMVLIPLIGQAIYLVFGQRYKYRKELEVYRQKETFKYEIKDGVENANDILIKEARRADRGIYNADVQLYSDINEAYKSLFADLEAAEKEINIHYYIIKKGEIYEQFQAIIAAKAKAGVKVRLLVDDFGRWALPWYKINDLEKAGVEVAIFNRVHFPFVGSSNGYRSHRKVVIIDSKILHMGGINIADEYASLNKQYGYWIDFNTRIVGGIIRSYMLLFIDDWKLITNQQIPIEPELENIPANEGKSQLVMLESSPEIEVPQIKDSMIALISKAKRKIDLVSPYFTPPRDVVDAIRAAAVSGVEVNLFIPGRPDKRSVWIGSRAYAKEVMGYGVNVYEVNNILIHSKFGIFDEEYAYFGTANIDMRSFYSQFEIVNIATGQIVQDLQELLKTYYVMSKRIDAEYLHVNAFKNRLITAFVLLFSPLM